MTQIWVWTIVLCQIVSLVIVVDRVYKLFFKRKISQKDLSKEIVNQGSLEKALKYVESLPSGNPVIQVARAGIEAALENQSKEEIQLRMDKVLLAEANLVEKRIGYLALFANVATLFGLIGTIVGLVQSFSAMPLNDSAEKTRILSEGISLAMNTTAYGLLVAVPALIMYAILQNRASRLNDDLNKAGLNIFIHLGYHYSPTVNQEGKVIKFERKGRDEK